MATREGPSIRVTYACHGCEHLRWERFQVQGDSGHDYYCFQRGGAVGRLIGSYTDRTPHWCPLLPAARETFAKELLNVKGAEVR